MSKGQQGEELAAQAADAVRRIVAEAESRAAEIVRDAESEATKIRESAERDGAAARERAEADARGQIEAAKRALDELGGTLAAAATSALPKSTPQEAEAEKDPEPEPALEPEPEEAVPASANGDDAAERLEAMKMAVDGKDQSAIEAALTEKFGPGDRTLLVKEVLERVAR